VWDKNILQDILNCGNQVKVECVTTFLHLVGKGVLDQASDNPSSLKNSHTNELTLSS